MIPHSISRVQTCSMKGISDVALSTPNLADSEKPTRSGAFDEQGRQNQGREPELEDVLRRWIGEERAVPLGDGARNVTVDPRVLRAENTGSCDDGCSVNHPETSRTAMVEQANLPSGLEADSRHRRESLNFPKVGALLHGYRLHRELGRGAFARVYLAGETELAGRLVALKVSRENDQEPQVLAHMQHSNIMPIYSIRVDPRSGLRALCMPYVGGACLSDVLARLWSRATLPTRGSELLQALRECETLADQPGARAVPDRLTPPRRRAGASPMDAWRDTSYIRAVAWLASRLAEGLQHAHQRGILHRDIKPSNILLAADGQPMLLDFNLSPLPNDDNSVVMIGGTVSYMAPEHLHAMGRRTAELVELVDERSDIYSLGTVVYKMLTGQIPFEISRSYSVLPEQFLAMAEVRKRHLPSARQVRSDVPWSLESILRKCLAAEPGDRYQRTDQLATDLRCFLEDRPLQHAVELSKREKVVKWTRRHPRMTQAGGIVLACAVLLGIAGAAMATLSEHLVDTREALAVIQANNRGSLFTTKAVRAQCFINTSIETENLLTQGVAECEEALSLYNLLDAPGWQEPQDWIRLPAPRRQQLAESTRELLLLLAAGKVRANPTDRQVLQHALGLLSRAEAIPALPPSRALGIDRARYLAALGQSREAEAEVARALAIPLTSARDYYQLATAHARAGRPQQTMRALQEIERALALDPLHYWSWLQRGICHADLGDLVSAAGDFGHCIGLWPEFAWGHFNLGVVQALDGRQDEAIESYSQSILRDPTLTAARVNRGLAELERKDHAAALADFDFACNQGMDDPIVHAGRGMALEALLRPKDADRAFERASELSKSSTPEALIRLRLSQGFAIASRLPQRARESFEAVLRQDPVNGQAHYGLAMLAMTQGDLSTAVDGFGRAVKASPSLLAARRYRAIALARLGEGERAFEDIAWCIEKERDSGATLYAAACVAAITSCKRNQPRLAEQAIEYLRGALSQGVGWEKAESDVDLAPIHDHPQFRQLLQRPRQSRAG